MLVALPPSFWTNTANCITADQSLYLNLSSLHSEYVIFNRKMCQKITPDMGSVSKMLGHKDVMTIDCRLSDRVMSSKDNLRLLQQNGIISSSEEYVDYKRYMYRILLNPSVELQQVIRNAKRLLFTHKHVLGVQVRMGGCLADYQEKTQMMTMDELRSLPRRIMDLMRIWKLSPKRTVIYLSTDSSYAEKFIRQKLGSRYEITVAKTFKRSHSRILGSDEPVKNALVDLYLLADSDALIVCEGSGFGRAALFMTRAKHFFVYNVTHSIISDYKIRCKQ